MQIGPNVRLNTITWILINIPMKIWRVWVDKNGFLVSKKKHKNKIIIIIYCPLTNNFFLSYLFINFPLIIAANNCPNAKNNISILESY